MNDLQIFNHHSLPFDSPESAAAAVPEFLKLCLKAKHLGFETILMDESQDPSWFRIELARGYFFQNWHQGLGNRVEYRDNLRAFRSLATRTPYFDANDIGGELELFEVKENSTETEYESLKAAIWYDAPICGFATRSPWNSNPVEVTVTELDEQGMHSREESVRNWYSLTELEKVAPDLEKMRLDAIKSGATLWQKTGTLFPTLAFCDKAPVQLREHLLSQTMVTQVRESLHYLNLFAEKWRTSEVKQYSHDALRDLGMPHKVSGESGSTKKDPKLRGMREFWLASGRKELFENHVKLSNGIRIHFYPDKETQTIHVGYIGRHLPTVRHQG